MNLLITGSVVTPGSTITSPWTSGPPADSNGGPDTKNLDVGDLSDVSSFTIIIIEKRVPAKLYTCCYRCNNKRNKEPVRSGIVPQVTVIIG